MSAAFLSYFRSCILAGKGNQRTANG